MYLLHLYTLNAFQKWLYVYLYFTFVNERSYQPDLLLAYEQKAVSADSD